MKHRAFEKILLAAGTFAALGLAQPLSAATTVTMGVLNTNDPFNFILNPGEYFTFQTAAPFGSIILQNLETGDVITTFYVETAPGVFDTGNGIDPTVLSCAIGAGGSCTASDFGPVAIDLSEMGGVVSGSYTFGPQYYSCFAPGETPVDGAECGRDFSFLPRMLFDAAFAVPDQRFAYTLTISTSPIGAIPEPATWAMMIGGFGLVGGALRHRRAKVSFA